MRQRRHFNIEMIRRTPSYQSCSQQSTHSCVSVLRNRSPSPLHMAEKLEELLHGNIDLPPASKRVERHVPWVVETMKHRRSHHSVSVSAQLLFTWVTWLEICCILVANATMFSNLLPGFSCGSKHLLLP